MLTRHTRIYLRERQCTSYLLIVRSHKDSHLFFGTEDGLIKENTMVQLKFAYTCTTHFTRSVSEKSAH